MNQMYAEAGVKRKDTLLTMTLRILLILGIFIGIMIIILFGKFYFTIIGMALIAVMVFLFPKLNVEYEYVFVDGQIDFDQITGKAKRKTLLQIDMDQIELVAPQSSHTLDAYINQNLELKDFSSGRIDSKPYIIISQNNNRRYRIAFEPSEKMLTLMKQKSPRKVELVQ